MAIGAHTITPLGISGMFDRMIEVLAAEPDAEGVMFVTSIIRVHQHGVGVKGGNNSKPKEDRGEA